MFQLSCQLKNKWIAELNKHWLHYEYIPWSLLFSGCNWHPKVSNLRTYCKSFFSVHAVLYCLWDPCMNVNFPSTSNNVMQHENKSTKDCNYSLTSVKGAKKALPNTAQAEILAPSVWRGVDLCTWAIDFTIDDICQAQMYFLPHKVESSLSVSSFSCLPPTPFFAVGAIILSISRDC